MERYFFSVKTESGEIWDPAGIPFLFPADALAFGATLARRIASRTARDGEIKTVTVRGQACDALATFTVGEKPRKARAPRRTVMRPVPAAPRHLRLADQPHSPR